MKSVIIIGAGGHGKVIADIIKKSGDKIYGFLDDSQKNSNLFIGYPILGDVNSYKAFKKKCEFIIAIGNSEVREAITQKLNSVKWYTAIHPTSVISVIDTKIQEGTVVMANAVINAGSHIGKHCIINTGAIIEHDNLIEDYVHISVGAKLAGSVHIGKSTWIGIGANINNNLNICNNCMIGAGATVVTDITTVGTYVGVPAKMICNGRL